MVPSLLHLPARVGHAAGLRIAMVSEYYYPHLGGVTEHVHYLSRELRRLGHHVDIITSTIDPDDRRDDVVRLGRSVPVYGNASMARITVARGLRDRMRGVLRDGRYDLVHVHCPLNPTLPMLAIEAAQVPVVGTVHTWFPASLAYAMGRRYFQRLLDRVDIPVAVSEAAAKAHDRYFRADWRVVPNGIDLDEFHPHLARPAGMSGDAPTILFVGRFDPRNSLGMLFEAFTQVQRSVPDARLVVVGDGPLRRHYRRLASANPGITFTGPLIDERAAHYAAASVYACPTTRASFGITLLEAMATGTPVVCSDLHGFRCVVSHEQEALLTPVGDVQQLARALVRVLTDDALRKRLGSRGLDRARQFSWPIVARQLLELYASAGVSAATAA
ncbi:MAG: glycosyltransferase family 4 protein [Gemmatimonadota bacterium]